MLAELDTQRLPSREEHFGCRDGIAQPEIRGFSDLAEAEWESEARSRTAERRPLSRWLARVRLGSGRTAGVPHLTHPSNGPAHRSGGLRPAQGTRRCRRSSRGREVPRLPRRLREPDVRMSGAGCGHPTRTDYGVSQ